MARASSRRAQVPVESNEGAGAVVAAAYDPTHGSIDRSAPDQTPHTDTRVVDGAPVEVPEPEIVKPERRVSGLSTWREYAETAMGDTRYRSMGRRVTMPMEEAAGIVSGYKGATRGQSYIVSWDTPELERHGKGQSEPVFDRFIITGTLANLDGRRMAESEYGEWDPSFRGHQPDSEGTGPRARALSVYRDAAGMDYAPTSIRDVDEMHEAVTGRKLSLADRDSVPLHFIRNDQTGSIEPVPITINSQQFQGAQGTDTKPRRTVGAALTDALTHYATVMPDAPLETMTIAGVHPDGAVGSPMTVHHVGALGHLVGNLAASGMEYGTGVNHEISHYVYPEGGDLSNQQASYVRALANRHAALQRQTGYPTQTINTGAKFDPNDLLQDQVEGLAVDTTHMQNAQFLRENAHKAVPITDAQATPPVVGEAGDTSIFSKMSRALGKTRARVGGPSLARAQVGHILPTPPEQAPTLEKFQVAGKTAWFNNETKTRHDPSRKNKGELSRHAQIHNSFVQDYADKNNGELPSGTGEEITKAALEWHAAERKKIADQKRAERAATVKTRKATPEEMEAAKQRAKLRAEQRAQREAQGTATRVQKKSKYGSWKDANKLVQQWNKDINFAHRSSDPNFEDKTWVTAVKGRNKNERHGIVFSHELSPEMQEAITKSPNIGAAVGPFLVQVGDRELSPLGSSDKPKKAWKSERKRYKPAKKAAEATSEGAPIEAGGWEHAQRVASKWNDDINGAYRKQDPKHKDETWVAPIKGAGKDGRHSLFFSPALAADPVMADNIQRSPNIQATLRHFDVQLGGKAIKPLQVA